MKISFKKMTSSFTPNKKILILCISCTHGHKSHNEPEWRQEGGKGAREGGAVTVDRNVNT
jgi:hypothetical protein